MRQQVTLIKIFVGGPGDVDMEKKAMKALADQINHTTALARGIQLFAVNFEDDVLPGFGDDAQAVINAQIDFGSLDLFIGILWKRFGTKTNRAESGTEEEFEKCYSLWSEHKRPRLLLYFNSAPFSREDTDAEQLGRVTVFQKRVEARGGLSTTYNGINDFKEKVRRHLDKFIESLDANKEINDQAGTIVFAPANIPLPVGAKVKGVNFRLSGVAQEHHFKVITSSRKS